jgi:hypothetical protein
MYVCMYVCVVAEQSTMGVEEMEIGRTSVHLSYIATVFAHACTHTYMHARMPTHMCIHLSDVAARILACIMFLTRINEYLCEMCVYACTLVHACVRMHVHQKFIWTGEVCRYYLVS